MPLLGDDRGELRGVDDGDVRGVLLCFFFCGEGVLLTTVSGVDFILLFLFFFFVGVRLLFDAP